MESSFQSIVSLWRLYNNISSLLIDAMGGTANEVGEFAEVLVAKYYNGEQLPASNKSADIKTKNGNLIQVKSRRMKRMTITSLNVIRSWDFDLLVVVLFNKDGNVLKAIEIDSKTAEMLSTRNKHQNGLVLTTNRDLLDNEKASDITKDLQNIIDGKAHGLVSDKNQKNSITGTKSLGEHDVVRYSNNKLLTPPVIELYPSSLVDFKTKILHSKQARRTWFYSNGKTKADIWNASNLSETSNIKANIKTNNIFRRWKELGIIKVYIEVI